MTYPRGSGYSGRVTDNLPARQDDPTGPGGVPLSQAPSEVLSFALGYIAARPVTADQWGGVTALVEELMRRDTRHHIDHQPDNPALDGSVWNALVRLMPPDLARSLQMLYAVHRGQRWAKTGRRT